ncbi:MAG: ATP-binding protein [Eubacteriales bacterium]
MRNIHYGAKIDGLYRVDSYELPTDCIRELICNAVTHRSYLDESCIQIALFDNRLEITSPGMLFGGLTIDDIKEGRSKPRNRGIAYTFVAMKIIEKWGTDIPRIIQSCKNFGIQEPEFIEFGMDIRVNLYRKIEMGTDKMQESADKIKGCADKIEMGIDKMQESADKIEMGADKMQESADKIEIGVDKGKDGADKPKLNTDIVLIGDVADEIFSNEERVMAYLKENPSITNGDVQQLCGIKETASKNLLRKMVEKKLLKAIGEKKSRVYKLNL